MFDPYPIAIWRRLWRFSSSPFLKAHNLITGSILIRFRLISAAVVFHPPVAVELLVAVHPADHALDVVDIDLLARTYAAFDLNDVSVG